MKRLAEHVSTFLLVGLAVVAIVFGSLDEKRCAQSCGGRGYSYNSGCTGPTVCLCSGAAADGGTVSR